MDSASIKLAEQQHRIPLEIVEAFKAGVEWRDHMRRRELLDADAKHFAMTGDIRHHRRLGR